MSRHDQFVGKGFLLDGLYKLSAMSSSTNVIFSSQVSVANVECLDIWHGRLGHVNKNTMKRMMFVDVISKSPVNEDDKCQICVEVKQPRKPLKYTERKPTLLELIHSNLRDK